MKRLSRLRKRHLRGAQEGSWAVSYGDMITLLLGFYIMYFSIDPPKKTNTSLTSSLITALEKLDEQVTVDKTAAVKDRAIAQVPGAAETKKAVVHETQAGRASLEAEKAHLDKKAAADKAGLDGVAQKALADAQAEKAELDAKAAALKAGIEEKARKVRADIELAKARLDAKAAELKAGIDEKARKAVADAEGSNVDVEAKVKKALADAEAAKARIDAKAAALKAGLDQKLAQALADAETAKHDADEKTAAAKAQIDRKTAETLADAQAAKARIDQKLAADKALVDAQAAKDGAVGKALADASVSKDGVAAKAAQALVDALAAKDGADDKAAQALASKAGADDKAARAGADEKAARAGTDDKAAQALASKAGADDKAAKARAAQDAKDGLGQAAQDPNDGMGPKSAKALADQKSPKGDVAETLAAAETGHVPSETALQTIMEILLPKEWVDRINEQKLSAKLLTAEQQEGSAFPSKTSAAASSRDGMPSGSSAEKPKAGGYRLDVTEIKALEAEASRIGDRVYIMFPKVSFFASASTEITPEGRRALEKFSKVYTPFAGKALLNIVGFSDERPVKGIYRFRDNLELSVLRAVSAQRVAESVGIPLNRTRLMGHGINTRLVEGELPANTLERWALTRKIMLVIEPEVP